MDTSIKKMKDMVSEAQVKTMITKLSIPDKQQLASLTDDDKKVIIEQVIGLKIFTDKSIFEKMVDDILDSSIIGFSEMLNQSGEPIENTDMFILKDKMDGIIDKYIRLT